MSLERYFSSVLDTLQEIQTAELAALRSAAGLFAQAIKDDRLIYTFGTGHSSLLASEGLYRAGGLACVSTILESPITFEAGAIASSFFERTQNYARVLLARYELGEGDVLVVFSNSGVNALPVEVTVEAKIMGARVVAVLSKAYAQQAPRTAASGQSLAEVADLVIDNHVPPGDAVVPFYDETIRAASVSTVAGAFIWNALVAETVSILEQQGINAPVYISSNMPGAKENNDRLVQRYRTRVRHL